MTKIRKAMVVAIGYNNKKTIMTSKTMKSSKFKKVMVVAINCNNKNTSTSNKTMRS